MTPSDLGGSFSCILSFFLFYAFHGVLLKKEMATQPSILTLETPWTKEPVGLQSMQLQMSQTHLVIKNSMGVLQTRTLTWVAISFSSDQILPELFTMTCHNEL